MLTKSKRDSLKIAVAVLISLVLAGTTPFLAGGYASATETDNSVDIIQQDVNPEGSEMNEGSADEIDGEDQDTDSESKKDKKKNKKNKKNKKDSEQIADNNDDNNDENANQSSEEMNDTSNNRGVSKDADTSSDDPEEVDLNNNDEITADNEEVSEAADQDKADKEGSANKDTMKKSKKKNKDNKDNVASKDNDTDEDKSADDADASNTDVVMGIAAADDSDKSGSDKDIYNEENGLTDEALAKDGQDTTKIAAEGDDSEQDEELSDEDKTSDKDKKEKKDKQDKKDKKAKKDKDENIAIDDQIIDGFPSTYMPLIQEMQAAHPNWTFVPVDTGVTFKQAVKAENQGSTSLISASASKAQRHKSGKTYDGGLYRANKKTIAHYMDPRNFLNENEVFQFLQQGYSEGSQNVDTVAAVIDGSFMDGKTPGEEYETYQACIDDVGEQTGVNSNVLAAMIIQEQGWDGSSLVSGKKDGYKGYYNFFNVGAWTTSDMSNSERGLWYAKGEGENKTSYQRPWDSPYKAILGGAEFYYENYISANQDTYYTKKFNVANGADAIGEHQYMTNLDAANDEGKLVRKAYENNPDVAATFEIPVYSEMPAETAQLPE